MSQPDSNQDPEKGSVVGDDPRSTQIELSQGETNLDDSSDHVFDMYSKVAKNEDKKMAERWQKDANGIIIFTGLFSAVVATLIVLSVQDLKPDPQDTSAFYLEHIYQLLADPNVTRPSMSSVAKPPPFSPPTYALWVNSLWFLSLVISLSCAMLATSLEQWARRYLRITRSAHGKPEMRARSRAFFANGVNKFRVSWVVEALPTLVHVSLFLFFAGLLVYLFHTNHTVFTTVVSWVAGLTGVYGCITLMPIFGHDSPYYVPTTTIIWWFYASVRYFIRKVYSFIRSRGRAHAGIVHQKMSYSGWMFGGVDRVAAKAALRRPSRIDAHVLELTIDGLGDDDALEKFFECIPAFRETGVFKDLSQSLLAEIQLKIVDTLGLFLRRTLSSNSVDVSVRNRRLAICLAAACEVSSSLGAQDMINTIINGNLPRVSDFVEAGHVLQSWNKSKNERFTKCRQALIAVIIASVQVQERSNRWAGLVRNHLGVREVDFQDYLTHGNGSTVLLANLNHFIRHFTLPKFELYFILTSLSNFDIGDTLPRLQHEFCSLWNKLVEEARKSDKPEYSRPIRILRVVRNIYIKLHRETEAAPTAFNDLTDYFDDTLRQPLSYPWCNISGHSVPASVAPSSPSLSDVPSRDDLATSIINPSHPASQVPQPNPATLIGSAVANSAQATADRPVISSTVSAPPSISMVTMSNLQPALRVTGISSSSSPPMLPANAFPLNLHSSPTSSSQANWMPPSQGLLPSIPRQAPLFLPQIAAPTVAAMGALDDPQDLNDPALIGISVDSEPSHHSR